MTTQREHEIIIVDSLQAELQRLKADCLVVRQNQAAPIPKYPYCSYTITTPMLENSGTYGNNNEDQKYYQTYQQVWSFTVQSDNDSDALQLAVNAYNFFAEKGTLNLNDKGVIVVRLSNVANRDNLISIEYEHRYGFDVTFSFTHEVNKEDEFNENYFDKVKLNN
ncbi:MAG: hypothetical protein IKK84_00225 [Clostridia bacterium]|nr:hypothetical protein [Clostridia bacterium]